ncbi:MAG: alanine--tRNA ligase [Deltaproteobacteria bacterium]|nr:alanine--tRNA ligase [Deltaproteobacteria bacterium]
MQAADIRARFLEFFRSHGHEIVPSSPLVPQKDPTLFFTNAGMVQFKDVFTGAERRSYRRAASVQKCLRVSGKHNDLENVGHTPRHHTFFEMLGNFSFGDYFKAEAIPFAWDLLTRDLSLPPERLWVTVHHDDDEAYDLWHRAVGVPVDRIQRLGDKDNFWSMGETGPCGPCSEIHFDHGDAHGPGQLGPASESARYVEIWNLVFMQYERRADGTLTPLPRPSIDTGAGLERIAAACQGVFSNYDSDCFTPIMARIADLAGVGPGRDEGVDVALRVVSDHARAAAFLVSDGVMPSNLERGYVLRRILRRAIRYGVKIGVRDPFLWKVADAVVDQMGSAWPDLLARRAFVTEVIRTEEERFAETLDRGLGILERAIEALPVGGTRVLDGQVAFRLHDTYGFPLDLTRLIAAEQGVTLDEAGYEQALEAQRSRGRAAWRGSGEEAIADRFHQLAEACPTRFTGYDHTQGEAVVHALVAGEARVPSLAEGDEGLLVVDVTPFYGEAGGQCGDSGEVRTAGGASAEVIDATRPHPDLVAHRVRVREGALHVGDTVHLAVDVVLRDAIRRNHSATHLLHAALKRVLGPHVAQKGSLVSPERLRFDFSHFKAMEPAEIDAVEDIVQEQILADVPLETTIMTLEEARASGAEALFGERYGERVRVVRAGAFSAELCGGTHVRRTGEIGAFRVVQESGIAAGVRRIEARTGMNALRHARAQDRVLAAVAERLHAAPESLLDQVDRLLAERRSLEKENETLRRDLAHSASGDLLSNARTVEGLEVLAAELPGDPATLREEAERLRDRLGDRAVVVLGSRADGQVRIVACVARGIAGRPVHAGDLARAVAARVGGGGGGRPDMAQAGGKDTEALPEALDMVYTWVGEATRAS